jgi:plasmid stabilization system protein ParE
MAEEYKIVITQEARQGLKNIVEYLEEEASYTTAENVRNGILEAIESLARMPQRHGLVKEISDEKTVYRRILKWRYRIIYVINEEKIEVRVIDISSGKKGPGHLEEVKKRT